MTSSAFYPFAFTLYVALIVAISFRVCSIVISGVLPSIDVLFYAADRRRRVEHDHMPLHQPVEEAP